MVIFSLFFSSDNFPNAVDAKESVPLFSQRSHRINAESGTSGAGQVSPPQRAKHFTVQPSHFRL